MRRIIRRLRGAVRAAMVVIGAAMAAAMVAVASPAAAQPLTLDEVLRASAAQAPAILEAMAREGQAAGRRLSADGAFDLVFEGEAQSRLLGSYGGSYAEARAVRPLAGNGGSAHLGYRVSRGAFPVYEDKAYTNRLGELRAGAVLALMRDRLVDERRTRIGLAEGDVALARLEREMVAIGVQRRAIDAYQAWVAAGMRVAVYRDLYRLASARQASIERQVRLGARPSILATENRQNMVRRRAMLVRAEQELAAAANGLSLYLRDAAGAPVVPAAERLPAGFPALRPPAVPAEARAIGRPELTSVLVRLDQAAARRAQAENELLPRLDLRIEAAKDLGEAGLGGAKRTPAEAYVGLKLSLPFERRQARGRIAEARAEADALRLRQRAIEEQIRVELDALAIQVEATDRLATLAREERGLAERMAEAERRRFELGASDFMVVNLREEAAADAGLRLLDAEHRRSAARAELVAATVDRAQLGL